MGYEFYILQKLEFFLFPITGTSGENPVSLEILDRQVSILQVHVLLTNPLQLRYIKCTQQAPADVVKNKRLITGQFVTITIAKFHLIFDVTKLSESGLLYM